MKGAFAVTALLCAIVCVQRCARAPSRGRSDAFGCPFPHRPCITTGGCRRCGSDSSTTKGSFGFALRTLTFAERLGANPAAGRILGGGLMPSGVPLPNTTARFGGLDRRCLARFLTHQKGPSAFLSAPRGVLLGEGAAHRTSLTAAFSILGWSCLPSVFACGFRFQMNVFVFAFVFAFLPAFVCSHFAAFQRHSLSASFFVNWVCAVYRESLSAVSCVSLSCDWFGARWRPVSVSLFVVMACGASAR